LAIIKFLFVVILFGLLSRAIRSFFGPSARPERSAPRPEGGSRADRPNPDRPGDTTESGSRPAPRIQPHDVIDVPFEDVPAEEVSSDR